jgi:TorA maturation chaperone TorD
VTCEAYPANDNPDTLRGRTYGLLGNLLSGPPGAALLAKLSEIESHENGYALTRAWCELGRAARRANATTVDDEYHDLFIGIARGELVPYASWYRTGLLMERPLANLRAAIRALRIERCEDVSEPEDHIAALCQTMAILNQQPPQREEDDERRWARERAFFAEHLAPWCIDFFEDLSAARAGEFYRAVGGMGLAFLDFEWRFLEIDDLPKHNKRRRASA